MSKIITILGVNGSFGILFSDLLSHQDQTIINGIDLSVKVSPSVKCSAYISSDITKLNEDVRFLISKSDLIIMCLPEDVAYHFLDIYKSYISKNSLLVDTLSVKSQVVSIYNNNGLNALSLNPMFGPDLPFEGKNMIVVKIRESGLSEWFISLLSTLKVNLVYLTGATHDEMTALVQVATHAAVMAFGSTLNQSKIPLEELLKIATPPFINICTLFARITSGTKNVYWSIQKENVYASEIRRSLINNMVALDKNVQEGREQAFNQLIQSKNPAEEEIFRTLSQNFNKS